MTLAEIARLAGVSRTTASYVINGKARERRISQDTVDRVMAVVGRYHYRVDAQAAALRRGSSRLLGLIVPDLENASYARLAKLLEQEARQRGYHLLIAGSDDEMARERELALALRAQGCDALITASCLPMEAPFYRDLMESGLPVVAMDRGLDPTHFASVVSNDRQAAERLTRVALDAPVQRVAWFDAVPALSISRERRAGFQDALARHDMEASLHSAERYDRAAGAGLMRSLLDEHGLPDVLITASYALLDGVFDVLLEDGGLPDGLRLATFGDNRLLDFLPLAVDSAVQDHARIAATTLACAEAAANGDYRPGHQVIGRTLHRRSAPLNPRQGARA
ncbi:catabolite repressor/activator [Halomonas elongata]|uniref:Catabolite repressor/activator n=2 Tax=Halomonas elongata TaxID=2746 RepID=E1V8C7_HALED|nr:catabolite repressor/activator [Halomonas elongata]OBX34437.1 catabolite repressor/activator [Halomonas elongata]WBF17326.1 catabolite repressor/activator [Halomonas elongata]WPU46162.1 catabolite repressor/activator [Halomonas elongata DSM 2581]WVI70960.1 catabolite repressor/activator [Halomonas elongata]CBV43583.1 LacI family transcription regulator FruR [Halomonas elongata DSM 2581]